MGDVQAGFTDNFAYGTISLITNNYTELVPDGSSATAVYADELIVPSGATLNLNGLHIYVRGEQIGAQAAIVDGTVTLVAGGGAIAKNTAVPADLVNVGEQDDWSFFGFRGRDGHDRRRPGLKRSPGRSIASARVGDRQPAGPSPATCSQRSPTPRRAPARAWRSATSRSRPRAPTRSRSRRRRRRRCPTPTLGQSDSTGFYQMEIYDVTPEVNPLVLGQAETGTVDGPFGVADWTFSGTANELVRLSTAVADAGIEFNLTGPGSYSVTGLTQGQEITLPSSGDYVLSVDGTGTSGINYQVRA